MRLARSSELVLWMALLSAGALAQTHDRRKPVPAAPIEPAPTSYTVENLFVAGNRAYTADQILRAAGLRVGQKAGKSDFEAARDKLDATGAFDRVNYRFAPSKDGEGYDATSRYPK